jgi:hypothetical protein
LAYSSIKYLGDGSNRNFSVTFPYISKDHVKATINGTPVALSWLSTNVVQLATVPAAGTTVEISRTSSQTSRLTDFVDGSTLTESDLDLGANQSFMMAQEALDRSEGSIPLDWDGHNTAKGRRIKDIANPVAGTDAANKDYVTGLIGNIGTTDSLFDQTEIPVVMYNNTGEGADGLAKRLLRGSHPGSHAGQAISNLHLEANPPGSGKNGPAHADFGLSIRANKNDWVFSNTPGEIDGINIAMRQGGPEASSFDTSSDGCAILANVQSIGNTGYHGGLEMAISRLNRGTYTIDRSMAIQAGIIDDFGNNPYDLNDPQRWTSPNPRSFGWMANAIIGEHDVGVLIQETGGTWKEFAHFTSNEGSQFVFKRDGRLQFGNGSNRMTIKNHGGHLTILNSPETDEVVAIYQDGKIESLSHRLVPDTIPTAEDAQQGLIRMGGDGKLYICLDGATWHTVDTTPV